MATQRKRSARGAARTELLAIRFDPRLKYLVDIAARGQHRSVSSFIEETVERAVNDAEIASLGGLVITIASVADELWDVDEPDRFFRLASRFPALLTYNEQKLWKKVRETFELLEQNLDGSLNMLEILRRRWWMFDVCIEFDEAASTISKAIHGDPEAQDKLLDLRAKSQGPFQKERKADETSQVGKPVARKARLTR
jgi:hypothetical protein